MAGLKPFNVGEVVRALSDAVLTGTDGVKSTRNAYPFVLEQVLLQLSVVTDQVRALLDEQLKDRWIACITGEFGGCRRDMGKQLEQIERDLDAWTARLETYRELNNECVASGRLLDWECKYWCVTSPLLFGWYPNERCDGVAMWQTVQKPPDMATPFSLLNQAIVLGAFVESEGFISYTETFVRIAVEAAATAIGDVADAAVEAAVNAAIEAVQKAFTEPSAGGSPTKPRWGRWVLGAAVVALTGYAIYSYAPKRR